MLGVSHVVTTSVGMCDIDIRPVSARLLFLSYGSEMPQIRSAALITMCNKMDTGKDCGSSNAQCC